MHAESQIGSANDSQSEYQTQMTSLFEVYIIDFHVRVSFTTKSAGDTKVDN